MYTEP